MLGNSCTVFEAQFRANEADGLPTDQPIKLIDIEPIAFKAMLNFIYWEDLSGINKGNVADVLATGRRIIFLKLMELFLYSEEIFAACLYPKVH